MDMKEKAEPFVMALCPVMFAQTEHGMAKNYFMDVHAFLLWLLLLAISLHVLLDRDGTSDSLKK